MLQSIRPIYQRFTFGETEVTTILDGTHVRSPLNPPFAMDKDETELEEIGRANRLPWDLFENSYTPTLIKVGDELVLVDVGFGQGGRESGTGHLRERLREVGHAPEDVSIVVFTHVHPDHILGVNEGDGLAFPNARHMIGRREFDAWLSGDEIPSRRDANRQMFMELIVPLADRLTFLEDGDQVVSGLTAEAAYGHSVGHLMFRLESAGKQLLVWGDVANHYVYSVQYPESPVGFDDDRSSAAATRKRVLEMAATDELLICGHHMPCPSVGYIERSGAGYRWVPASYQLWI